MWQLFGTIQVPVSAKYLVRLSRLAKGTPSESRLFVGRLLLVWGKIVPCSLCAVQSKCTLKREKCCFWIWLRPRYKIPEFLTIAPVLTSTLTVCRRSVVSIYYIGLRVVYDRGPSRPTSVFRVGLQQYVCAKFIQIGWDLAVRGPKNLFWSKNRERPNLYVWPSKTNCQPPWRSNVLS